MYCTLRLRFALGTIHNGGVLDMQTGVIESQALSIEETLGPLQEAVALLPSHHRIVNIERFGDHWRLANLADLATLLPH